jgi:hypothetical protein
MRSPPLKSGDTVRAYPRAAPVSGIASDHLDSRYALPQACNIANFKTKNS